MCGMRRARHARNGGTKACSEGASRSLSRDLPDDTGSTSRWSEARSPSCISGRSNHPQTELNARLRHFDLEVLDAVDVVVSKLKRFNPNDRTDIEAMVERSLVPYARLLARFRPSRLHRPMTGGAPRTPRQSQLGA